MEVRTSARRTPDGKGDLGGPASGAFFLINKISTSAAARASKRGPSSVVRRRVVRRPDVTTGLLGQLLAQLRELTLERDYAVREFPQHSVELGDPLLVERRLDLELDDPRLGGGERRVGRGLFARVCT